MTDDLKKPQLRAIQYFYVDGSFEFGFGLLCLILAVYFYIETHVQGWLSALVDGALILVLLGGMWLVNRLVKRIKERLTYPRTGYLAYNRQHGLKRGWRLALGFGIGGLVAATVAILVTNPNIHIAVMPLIAGSLLGLVMGILGWRARLPRFYLLAGLSAVAGIALAFSGLDNYGGMFAYYLGFSLVLFATGACVLRTYLQRNPANAEEQS